MILFREKREVEKGGKVKEVKQNRRRNSNSFVAVVRLVELHYNKDAQTISLVYFFGLTELVV